MGLSILTLNVLPIGWPVGKIRKINAFHRVLTITSFKADRIAYRDKA